VEVYKWVKGHTDKKKSAIEMMPTERINVCMDENADTFLKSPPQVWTPTSDVPVFPHEKWAL